MATWQRWISDSVSQAQRLIKRFHFLKSRQLSRLMTERFVAAGASVTVVLKRCLRFKQNTQRKISHWLFRSTDLTVTQVDLFSDCRAVCLFVLFCVFFFFLLFISTPAGDEWWTGGMVEHEMESTCFATRDQMLTGLFFFFVFMKHWCNWDL